MSGTSTERPVSDKLVIDIDMDSDTAAESDFSIKSRSFLDRVNDRLRKMLNRSPEDSMQDIDKRSMIWECLCLRQWKHLYSWERITRQFAFQQRCKGNFTLKQMFEISEQLILEQSDEILGVSQIIWENSPWKQLSLVNDEEVISLSHAKVYVFPDSVLCLGKVNLNPTSTTVWERQLGWFKDSSQYRTWDDGEPMEFEWNIFPGFTTLQLVHEVQKFMGKMGEPEQFQGRIIFMSMFNDIIWRFQDNETECIANCTLVPVFAKRFPAGRWSFLGPGSETKWYCTNKERPGGKWDRVAEPMMIKLGESGHPVFRSSSPFSQGMLKSKGGGKLSFHFCADGDTIETVFRTIISVNQLSI